MTEQMVYRLSQQQSATAPKWYSAAKRSTASGNRVATGKDDRQWLKKLKDRCIRQQAIMTKQSGDADGPW